MSEREIDAKVAEKVMGWQRQPNHNYWMTFPPSKQFELHALIKEWSPTSNANHDHEVLKHVRETWIFSRRSAFARALHDLLSHRAGRDPTIREAMPECFLRYEVGDWSRAALAVLESTNGP